jgi:Protein of unknown function (DUF1579)
MIPRKLILALACCALPAALGAAALAVQDNGMPPPPKPSPEHKILQERVGTWDAALQMWMGPGEPQKSTGAETNRMLGEFHLLSTFEAKDMMGGPFEGHGILSWDPNKKKFVSIWVDTMEPTPAVMEGTHDAKAHTLTFTGEIMMNGQRAKMRQVATSKDADHATFEMYTTGPDGKEAKMMQIDYTRRK